MSWALRLGASSDVKASTTVGMLPTLSPSSGGVGVGSYTNWDPNSGLKKKTKKKNAASSGTLLETNTKFFGHPGLVQIGFRLCHPLPQQTAAVFPVRRHFLAGQPDQPACGGAGSASQPGKPRAQSAPGNRAARRRPGACSQPRVHVSPNRLGRATRGSRLHLLGPAQKSGQNQADIRNLSDRFGEGRGEGWGGVGESCREQKL